MGVTAVLNRRPAVSPDRQMADTLRTLRRRFGDGVLNKAAPVAPEVIPTGFPALDDALGVGGLPRGRIVDIVGPESSGKSTLCLKIIAEAQRQGGIGVYVDTEHALDPAWARYCGVDIDRLYVSQPNTAEEGLEIVEALVRAGVEVVVVDSAAGLSPKAEVESDVGDHHLHGALMSQALRKLAGPVKKSNTLLIFTNQLRINSGVLFGSREKSTGGMALRHYASVRLDLRRIRAIKSGGQVIGSRIRATVKKNKVSAPNRRAEFDIFHGGQK